MAGTIGVNELACNTIILSIETCTIMVTIGVSEAACAIIGNCIGAGNAPLAKRFFTIMAKFEVLVILIVRSIIFFARVQIAVFFTSESEKEI